MTIAVKQHLCGMLAGSLGIFLAIAILFLKDSIPTLDRMTAVVEDLSVRYAAKPYQSTDIVVLDIDEASITKLGQWPWTRYRLGQILNTLTEMSPAAVAFDFIFSEPDRTSPSQIKPLWESVHGTPIATETFASIPDFDETFATALSKNGHTVLGCAFYLSQVPAASAADPLYLRRWNNIATDSSIAPRGLTPARSGIFPLPVLRRATRRDTGFLTITPDYDRIIRRTPLLIQYGDNFYSALSIEAVRLYLGKRNNLYRLEPDTGHLVAINLRERSIRLDPGAVAILNYRNNLPPTYSVYKILSNEISRKAIERKIVFLGTSAIGLHDLVNTPLGKSVSGVYIHTTLVDNMLTNDLLHTLPRPISIGCIIILGLLSIAAGLFFSIPVGTLIAILLAGVTFGSTIYLRTIVCAASPFEPLTAIVLGFALTALIRFMIIDKQRKAVREMFGSMVSPKILSHLENMASGNLALQGERRIVTVLFTDLEAFTSISEKLPPQQLTDLLRDYFEPMTEICLKHGAYINKFIGDAIMAVYNVPTELPKHVEEAVRSALEMQAKLAELRPLFEQKYNVSLRMRIGIHTGEATAGNIGSAKRFEYTVLGDTVNLASRLESENKKQGTWILITEAVRKQIPNTIMTRVVGEVIVRNRKEAALVHEVLLL
ncbi:MAG: adenylate/guanylate cyclase domain-containing protein [bacterium]